MFIKIIVFCSLAGCLIFQAGTASAWTSGDYDNYDSSSFAGLPEANERIDMDNIDYPLLHAAIFYASNLEREKHNLPVFLHSPALEKAAKGHSDDMAARGFFSHESPVSGKETMQKRLSLAGIRNAYMGENIAETFGIEYEPGSPVYTPDVNGGYFSYSYKGKPIENHTYLGFALAVVKQWMNSPGHRANILNPGYLYLGTGAAHYKNTDFHGMDYFKCVQDFSSMKGGE